ncbi:MAG: radical SAM protein, partial [Dehalococcoidia bacterium]|nr:radical SAM protein [Dehalococcoidia bacterium]
MDDRVRKLNIEITTRCNLNCPMCMRHALKEQTGDMSLDTYRALVPVFPQVESINLIGTGEPLLHENIIEIVRLGKANLAPDGIFSLTTNATLLSKDTARRLIRAGVDDIVVSVDSCKPDNFRQIRNGAGLEDVVRNIERFNRTKEQLGSYLPRVGFEFVAMKRNIAELPDIVDLAAQCRAGFVIVTHLLPHTEEMKDQILYGFNSDEAIELFNAAGKEARKRGLELTFETPDVANYAYALFGVPPLKDKLRSANPSRTKVRGFDEKMGRIFDLLDDLVATARQQNVLVNLKSLVQGDSPCLDHVPDIFAKAAARARKLKIDLDLPPLIPRTRRECGFIKDRIAFVSWDGWVRPCNNLYHSYTCYVNNREKSITAVNFGNVHTRLQRTLFFSPRAQLL